ncbi:MAG: DEAD/DEAH box helicase [Candidatus Aminicenantes bacterium]|nr:DEAD/DEAH box helicase [Candidatus Aminicenantes bacterium]
MNLRIADTFTDSLTKLSGQEQKAVKTTAFDLQLNPANPGLNFHKISQSKDPNFFSLRVNRDIRLIVHKTENSLLLCYVDHHDNAYRWAGQRKLETHPKTGAAQFVEVRSTVREITIPKYIEAEQPAPPKPLLFPHLSDEKLSACGVPGEWLKDVRNADEDSLLELAEHLPREAAEALLDLATGTEPQITRHPAPGTGPFDHPDAQRRFRVMNNIEELERALEYPWEKWTVFLHPMQKQLVEQDYSGPARIFGTAGTGKTIVALHRAVFLARQNPDARVLLTTFSETLANSLRTKLRRLIGSEPRLGERLEVNTINETGHRLSRTKEPGFQILSNDMLWYLVKEAAGKVPGHHFSLQFLLAEWEQVIDAWQIDSWEAYRDVLRLGRKTRLPEKQRRVLWAIFKNVLAAQKSRDMLTYAGMFNSLAIQLKERKHPPFDYVVVDEAQDVSVPQLRFLSALAGSRRNGLFFTGDLGQRIFQQPFSWKAVGVDIRGRSHRLRINYRTSHQIRKQADLLLAPGITDVDGITEERSGTISLFNGPKPAVQVLSSPGEETRAVGRWLSGLTGQGMKAHEIGVFVRSDCEVKRAYAAVESAGLSYKVLDDKVETTAGFVSICTMHLTKGLEFRAVSVMACDDEVLPLMERIETAADDTDLEEVYNTERHLLYVACTRARDHLLLTSVEPASEFLDDLQM